VDARTVPGLNRRGFVTASAAAAVGLGAAGCTASGAAAASTAAANTASGSLSRSGGSLTQAVLAAFGISRLVGLAEEHQLQEHHDLLQTLISDPRLPGVVDDIVVEFGNALYQDTIDTFVLDGQPVADADLRLVWRNTTGSPLQTWDAPEYEQFFRRYGRSTGRCRPASGSGCCSATRPSTGPRSQAVPRSPLGSAIRMPRPLWNSRYWPGGAGHCCATAASICNTPMESPAAGAVLWSRSSSSRPGCGPT
jgi:hypothetical protein